MINFRIFFCALGLLLADLLAWAFSFFLAAKGHVPFNNGLFLVGLWICWHALLRGKYFRRQPFWTELLGLIKVTISFMALGIFATLLGGKELQFLLYIEWWLSLMLLVVLARGLVRILFQRAGLWALPAIIFGSGVNAKQAAMALQSEPSMGYAVEAFVIPTYAGIELPSTAPNWPWPHKTADFEALLGYNCVIALEANQSELRDNLIRQLSEHKIKSVSVIPAMRGVPLFGTELTQFFSHEVLMLHVGNQLASPRLQMLKRAFDILGSATLLILLSPLFSYLAFKVSRDGGSVFFGHERVGQNGLKFKCYKFRSMVVNAQEALQQLLELDEDARLEWAKDFKLKNDPRINSIGHFLRRTSLDELPQLWNVLKGEMSLVGPRPVVQAELARYGEDVVYYLMVRPGMTGLWQISGRNDVDYATRVYFDSWYVKNWSLWTDIAILFKTISVVTNRNGAY